MSDKSQRKPMTDAEITTLARDIVTNRVFVSDQLHSQKDLELVFPVILFMKKKALQELLDGGVFAFYEYLERAAPRTVNGLPMFFSCRWLTKDEYQHVHAEERRMRIALGEKVPEEPKKVEAAK